MKLPLIEKPLVFHIGDLEVESRGARMSSSLEAFCLSVSEDPDAWKKIAKLGGLPTWEMSRGDAQWIDVLAITEDQWSLIEDWALGERLIEPAFVWRSWGWDEDGEAWYSEHLSQEDAEYEIDDPDEEDGPSPDGTWITSHDRPILTERAMSELERWDMVADARGGIIFLYARDVLALEDETVVGLWWDEVDDPEHYSAPRGGILPAALSSFHISPEGLGMEP